jgi:hypothetical protein
MASAQKKRQRKFPQADFEMPVAAAVNQLLRQQDIEPGDIWHFQVNGDVLVITRIRATIEEVLD